MEGVLVVAVSLIGPIITYGSHPSVMAALLYLTPVTIFMSVFPMIELSYKASPTIIITLDHDEPTKDAGGAY